MSCGPATAVSDGGGVGLTPVLRVAPSTPDVTRRAHLTRNERSWLSSRQRGFARRSRNSVTFHARLKAVYTLDASKGIRIGLQVPEAEQLVVQPVQG